MKWEKKDDEFLIKNTGLSAKEAGVFFGVSENAIRQRRSFLKINCQNYRNWNEKEIVLLRKIYPTHSKLEIRNAFKSRTWENIKAKARKLFLKRNSLHKEQINGRCERLLEENPESFYWLGFLLADGHFSKENRISLSVSKKDEEHIRKFVKFIDSKLRMGKYYATCSIMDKFNVKKIKDKFNISNKKTCEPPNFLNYAFPNDLLFSLICGFIDGDGHIAKQTGRNDCKIAIKLHKNWLEPLNWMTQLLNYIFNIKSGNPRLNKQGYAFVCFANIDMIKSIKQKAEYLNLPIMKRKWDLIEI